jgi:methionyl aminopeptidase
VLGSRSIARRSAGELAVMREAGSVVAEMHAAIRAAIRPGVSLAELDLIGRSILTDNDATSNFLGYHGYPAVICASVNEVVVHGIPTERTLEEGDIISIDCGAIVDGWHGDAAFTTGVGAIDDMSADLIGVAEASLSAAIAVMKPGARLSDIGHAVFSVVEPSGFGTVREYSGHGIGRAMHEEPSVPNFGRPGRGPVLEPGNVLAIEPMVTTGSPLTGTLDDGWTVVTVDRGRAAHAEHSVAITETGPQILTLPRDRRTIVGAE